MFIHKKSIYLTIDTFFLALSVVQERGAVSWPTVVEEVGPIIGIGPSIRRLNLMNILYYQKHKSELTIVFQEPNYMIFKKCSLFYFKN